MSNTIVAIATPLAQGGVSMIRISGDSSIEIADKVFKSISGKKLESLEGYRALYGGIYNQNNEQIDDGVALVYRAPRSYTGEDVVEISCHGGVYITREVLRIIVEHGAKLASAGEFSKRAFLNGKMSLTQAEAVMDLIQSHNTQALKSARAQMDGALFKRIESIKTDLLNIVAHLSAWVDYPEEDIEVIEKDNIKNALKQAQNVVSELIKTFDKGKIFKEGVQTVIVGKPNVGKSTLMNMLAGCEKSIVTDIAGTTRDVVEECVNIGNAVLRLADTAGIRETDDIVEKYGVELALKRIETAGLVLAVFDNSMELSNEDNKIIDSIIKRDIPAIAIINKTDLTKAIDEKYIKSKFDKVVYTSKEDENVLKELSNAIDDVLGVMLIDTSSGMIANERQRECALNAHKYIIEAYDTLNIGYTLDAVTVSIEYALESLLELTGERVTESVVNQVFHNFCVGK